MAATCPKDSTHKTFSTVVHITEHWKVDEDGWACHGWFDITTKTPESEE